MVQKEAETVSKLSDNDHFNGTNARTKRNAYNRKTITLEPSPLDWKHENGVAMLLSSSTTISGRNDYTIDSGPYKSEIDIDYDVESTVTGKIGIMSVKDDFLKVTTALKSKVTFDANIFQDSTYYSKDLLAVAYDETVSEVISSIQDPFNDFKEAFLQPSSSVIKIFEDFDSSLRHLRRDVAGIRFVARDSLTSTVGMYTGMSSVYRQAENVIERVNSLLNSVKTDVVGFYNVSSFYYDYRYFL
ncbi:uncharacterized protein [Ptychodera flava]|uniref:uncharacterized protein n=1 Tax=Ptychodera flava TaxID=63121 RepID=UPI00396A9BF5